MNWITTSNSLARDAADLKGFALNKKTKDATKKKSNVVPPSLVSAACRPRLIAGADRWRVGRPGSFGIFVT
jgi:hypothetical protein